MKTVLTIIAAAAVIAGAIYLSRAPDVERLGMPAVYSAPLASDSGSLPARAPRSVDAQPPNTPPSRSPGRYQPEGDFDPMLVMALGDFSDEEVARYNDLHILPFNKAVDRDCEEQPHPNFVDRTYTVCKTVREFSEHPYTELDTEALLELAVHDEVAALFLGRRVKQEEERLYWYLRAAALSEKSGPLMALAANRYSSVHTLKPVDGQLRAVEQLDNIAMRIALDTVARKMGDPRANPEQWQLKLHDVAAGKADAYLAQADALVAEFLTTMAQTQREITGSIQMQEIIDNA